MACIITYENKQYTQKEFEQYFKEHFTEFIGEFINSTSALKTSLGKELEYKDPYVPTGSLKNFKQYQVLDEKNNDIGSVVIEYRGDKTVILHPKLTITGKGYGKDLYKLISGKFNVDIQEWNEGDIANSNAAKKMWDSLEKEGVAKRVVDEEQGDNFRFLRYKKVGSKQDIEGFKNFVTNNNEEAPLSFSARYPEDTEVVTSLEEQLIDGFLKDFNITVSEYSSIKNELGIDAYSMSDLVTKTIAVQSGESILPEVVYFAYSMLGKQNNKIKSDLNYLINKWPKYKERFTYHKNIVFTKEGFIKDSNEGKNKIKNLIILDFLKEKLKEYYDNPVEFEKQNDSKWTKEDFSLWKKIIKAIESFIKKFSSSFNEKSKAKLENIGLSIIDEILNQNYQYFNYNLKEDQIRKQYKETIESDEFAKELVEFGQNKLNMVLTGSLALRKAGTVYRTSDETLHDIDWVVPFELSAKDPKFLDIVNKAASVASNEQDESLKNHIFSKVFQNEYLEQATWFKEFKQKYPSYKVINGFVGSEHLKQYESYTLTGVIDGEFYDSDGEHYEEISYYRKDPSTMKPVKEKNKIKVKHKKGDWIKDTGYVIDFFVRLKLHQEQHENYFKLWKEIMIAKIKMGREKDFTDWKAFVPYLASDNKFNFNYEGFRHINWAEDNQNNALEESIDSNSINLSDEKIQPQLKEVESLSNEQESYITSNKAVDANNEPILVQQSISNPNGINISLPIEDNVNHKKPTGFVSIHNPIKINTLNLSNLSDVTTLNAIRDAFKELDYDVEIPLKKTYEKHIKRNPKASESVVPVVEFMYDLFRYDFNQNNSKLVKSLKDKGKDGIIVYNNERTGSLALLSFNEGFVAINPYNKEEKKVNNTSNINEVIDMPSNTVFPNSKENTVYTTNDVLNNITKLDGKYPANEALAKALLNVLSDQVKNVPITLVSSKEMVTNRSGRVVDSFKENQASSDVLSSSAPGGLFLPSSNSIKVLYNTNSPSNTSLHEIVHAATYHQVRNNIGSTKMMNNFFLKAKEILIQNGVDPNHYNLSNVDEFMTGVFTNKDFIELLYNAPSTGISLGKSSKNLWEEFINVLGKVLGMDLEKDTLLKEALNNVMEVIEYAADVQRANVIDESYSQFEQEQFTEDYAMSFSARYPDEDSDEAEPEEATNRVSMNFTSEHSENQKKILDKIETTRKNLRGKVRMTADEVLQKFPKSKHIKLLSKVKDGLVRNIIWDEEKQQEVIVEKRPSDFSQLLYASIKNFDKKLHSEENNSLNSIYQRGIGTVSHEIVQQILMQLDELNSDFSLLKPQISELPKSSQEFFANNYDENFVKKVNALEADSKVKQMLLSLTKSDSYSVTLDEDQLIDPGSNKKLTEAERTFTITNEDFKQLAKLAFKLYHQIYSTQAQIAYINKLTTVNRPVILTEAPIYNKTEGVLGSIDVLAIFSNGQVGQLDFKFIDLSSAMRREENLSPEKIQIQKSFNIKTKNGHYILNQTMSGDEYIDFEVNRKMFIKVKSYDKQISAYKRGLMNSYGVSNEDIILSRIVPVNTILNYDTEEVDVKDENSNKTIKVKVKKLKPSVKYYEHEDKLLEQIPVAGELTGDPALDEFVNLLQKRLNNILLKIEKSPFDDKLIAQRDSLLNQVKTLQVKKDVKTIAYQLKELANTVLSNLESEKFISIQLGEGGEESYMDNPQYLTFMDLYDLEAMMDIYAMFRDSSRNQLRMIKDNYSEEEYNEINKIIQDQNQLTILILDRIKSERDKRLIESLEESDRLKKEGIEPSVVIDGKPYTFDISSRLLRNAGVGSDSRLSKFKDLSSVTGMYLTSLKDMNHPHLKMFSDLLDNLNSDVRIFLEDMKMKVEKETALLKEWADASGYSATQVYDLLYDDKSGDLYKEFDRSFYKALKEARANKDITWLRENLQFDKESYERRRSFQVKRLNDIYKNNPENFQKALAIWEDSNNMESTTSEYPWYNSYNYSYKIKDSKLDEFRSKEWQFIMNTPALKRYYEMYLSMNETIDNLTDGDYKIGKTFVANVHKDTVDALIQNGLLDSDKLSDVKNSLLNVLKVRENDNEFGATLDEAPVDGVPLYFYDDINLKDKSKDLSKSLLLMLYSAKLYRSSKDLEGISYAIRNSLANTRLLKTDQLGNVIPNEYVDPDKTENTNFVKALDKYINFYVYGRKIQGETSGLTKQGVKVANEVLAMHSKINLAWNSLPLIAGHVNVHLQLRQLGSIGKHFTIGQLNSSVRSFSRFDKKYGMLRHIFEITAEGHSGLVNEKSNKVSLSKLRKAYNKSLAFIWQRRSDDAIDDTILDAMAQNYILHPNGIDVFPRESAHIYLKGTQWEGKVDELKSIKEMLEVYDTKDISENTQLKDLYSIKRGNGEGEMTKIQYIKFRNKVQYLANRAKGNYNKEDVSLYKTSLLGRFLMQYRGWMPATIMERSMSAKYSYTMEEMQIGRYRTVLGEILNGTNNKIVETIKQLSALGVDVATFRLFKLSKINEQTQHKLFEQWKLNNPGDYEELLAKYNAFDDAEAEAFKEWLKTNEHNLTKLIAELRQYVMVSLLVLGVGFMAGDDEQKKNPVLRALVKHLNRVKLELGFYFSPDEFIKIATRSPMPITSILNDARKLIVNTIEETSDVFLGADKDKTIDYISAGDNAFTLDFFEEKKDQSPKFKYTFRMVPMLKGAINLLEIGEEGKDKQTFHEWLFGYDPNTFYK